MSFGKDIATYFFTKEGEEVGADNKVKTIFKCNSAHLVGKECASKGLFKVVISNGYTNLRSHMTTCIPNWQSIYDKRGILPVGDDIRQYVKVDKDLTTSTSGLSGSYRRILHSLSAMRSSPEKILLEKPSLAKA